MANGNMLTELRKMAETSQELDTKAALRLTLGALAEISDKLNIHLAQCTEGEDLNSKLDEMDRKLTEALSQIKSLNSNPIVTLGRFINNHPRWALGLLLFMVVNVILLVSSKPFLILVLSLAGVPKDAIEQFLILMSL